MASCLTERDSVSLCVRINGQTVRTKYMKVESTDTPQFTAKTGKWTPFHFEVIHRAVPLAAEAKSVRPRSKLSREEEKADVMTYGSIVVLVDLQSGVRSEAVKLVQVKRNEVIVGADEGYPISELQRVGFVRLENGSEFVGEGKRWYLSAPGAKLGGGELLDPLAPGRSKSRRSMKAPVSVPTQEVAVPETLDRIEHDKPPEAGLSGSEKPTKKRKTPQNALARATLAEDDDNSSQAILSWAKADHLDQEIVTNDGEKMFTRNVVVDKVEDWMCWVICGVCNITPLSCKGRC